jgi:hypothetical protein
MLDKQQRRCSTTTTLYNDDNNDRQATTTTMTMTLDNSEHQKIRRMVTSGDILMLANGEAMMWKKIVLLLGR